MDLGRVVDFVISYNERVSKAEKARECEEKRGKKRKATQADIDNFFG